MMNDWMFIQNSRKKRAYSDDSYIYQRAGKVAALSV